MILDLLEHLELPDLDMTAHQNELQSRDYLWQGLEWINSQVSRAEAEICKRLDCDNNMVAVMGNHPAFSGIPMGMLACAFHWYATSACNYVRLTGWLAYSGDTRLAADYVSRVIPSVKEWRNKVGAHFALVDPRDDTPANLAASVMFPIGFADRSLMAHAFTLSVSAAGKAAQSNIPQWSLTQVHDELRKRFVREGATT